MTEIMAYLSRPSPTAMIRLLSPSHSRSFLYQSQMHDQPVSSTAAAPIQDLHSTRKYLVLSLQALIFTDGVPDSYYVQ